MASSIDRIDQNKQQDKRLEQDQNATDSAAASSAAAANKPELKPADTKASGEDKTTAAVSQASRQQDAGQNWQAYADKQQDVSNVPNVNDIAAQEAQNDSKEEQQREQVRAANLQFDLAIQQSKLRC